ncbi:MAG: hypothetical protein GC164_04645 [Phycisphaera sp.]|nr:hypothetical protein [Phycisphaera sp.]
MRSIKRMVLTALLALSLAHPAAAGDTRVLQVTVTSTSGSSVFLDKGASSGVVMGMTVWLYPPRGAQVAAIVRYVSSNRARADLPPGIDVPPIGTRGEVEVGSTVEGGEGALGPLTPRSPDKSVPVHPPWSTDAPLPGTDQPLLAPIVGTRAEDRPTEFSGRIYLNALFTHDQSQGRNDNFVSARAGLSLDVTNPFKLGGAISFDGEIDNRSQFLTDGSNTAQFGYQIEQFSYTLGGHEYSVYRLEIGRFYSFYLPELGLIDGAEFGYDLGNRFTLAVGVGILPLSADEPNYGQDYGFHVLVNYESRDPGLFSGVVGYQKTWHKSMMDRDQVLGHFNLRIGDTLWFYTSFRADLYDSNDTIKSQFIQLTELWAQLRYAPGTDYGASVSYSLFRWPELLRDQYSMLPADTIRNGRVERVSFSPWWQPIKNWRLSGKFDLWRDENDDGTGGELRLDWSDPRSSWPAINGTVFYTTGGSNSGRGARLEARKAFREFDVFLGYEYYMYDIQTVLTGKDTLVRQLVRGGVSWSASKWYVSLTADYYFGDADDEITLGLFLSRRF